MHGFGIGERKQYRGSFSEAKEKVLMLTLWLL